MTPAEVIALEAARQGRRGPPNGYGRFPARLSADELAEFFFFDERDRELIARRRRESNKLGFAVQLGIVRYLGRFLEEPSNVPEQVVSWVARELGGADPSGLGVYARAEARWDHQAEIRREYGYREFHDPDVEVELVRWLEARAWVSAESHRAMFDRSVDHLIGAKVLLPGASVLWRLVGTVCHQAAERGYELIARGVQLTSGARSSARSGSVKAQARRSLSGCGTGRSSRPPTGWSSRLAGSGSCGCSQPRSTRPACGWRTPASSMSRCIPSRPVPLRSL